MHKKLAADLISLAHSILQMKNKEDVFALKTKAHDVYEKLALLAYVEEYINNTPNPTITKEELVAKVAAIEEKTKIVNDETPNIENEPVENLTQELIPSVENSFNEEILLENKDKEDIPFTIKELVEEDSIEDPVSEISQTITKKSDVIEQPFDELENIIFGDAPTKNEASFIEELKTPIPETEESTTQQPETIVTLDDTEPKTTLEETISTEENTIVTLDNAEPKLTLEDRESNQENTIITLENSKSDTKELTDISFGKESKTPTLEEELGDTLSVDVMANLFEKAPIKKTLNDRLLQDTIKIDLNDRIAFVKHLFEGNQEDFNRVISQLNTLKTEKQAKQFILKMVKPDYDWSLKEDYEARLFEIIERRFA